MVAYEPRPLPKIAIDLCKELDAPPRLVAHLRVVHDAAIQLTELLIESFPKLTFDQSEVLIGAAIHDLGKCQHINELYGPGNRHEVDGPTLLESVGVSEALSRFCRTHGTWSREELPFEDLLVGLADSSWKGHRLEMLEGKIVSEIAALGDFQEWYVFGILDSLLDKVASNATARLAWQAEY